MVVREGLTSLFHGKRDARPVSPPPPPPASWLWPSCKHPVTHSFRKEETKGTEYSYLDDLTESSFSSSSEAEYESLVSEASAAEDFEAVACGVRSDRLFFEPGSTSSIMEDAAAAAAAKAHESLLPFEGSIAMEVDSEDSYWDFRSSMEEVAIAHGVMDAQWLEEMLCWYMKMNGKSCHGIIIEAFLDLLLSLASSSAFQMKHEDVAVAY